MSQTNPSNNQGAGGTPGGIRHFSIGLAMMAAGLYLLLQSITITQSFSMSYALYTFGGGTHLTSGMILVPMCFGIALIFKDAKSLLGWTVFLGCLGGLILGVLASIHFAMRPMSLFDLLTMLTLVFGGLGLFLRSLRPL